MPPNVNVAFAFNVWKTFPVNQKFGAFECLFSSNQTVASVSNFISY